MKEQTFDSWCVVELFGHQVIVGRVTEQTIGGCPFLRVDVPAIDGQAAFSRFFGNGAIYSMTPVTEEIAMVALVRSAPRPVSVYGLLPANSPADEELDSEDGGSYHDED